jgi:hypothetical protein
MSKEEESFNSEEVQEKLAQQVVSLMPNLPTWNNIHPQVLATGTVTLLFYSALYTRCSSRRLLWNTWYSLPNRVLW